MPIKTEIRHKGVYVKLDRETHARFKSNLAQRGLTMQEAFGEFARLIANGHSTATGLLERFLREQVKEELKTAGIIVPRSKYNFKVRELDAERLYDLINEDIIPKDDLKPQDGGHDEAI